MNQVRMWASAVLGGLCAALAQPAAALAETGATKSYPPAHRPWSVRDYTDFYFVHWNGNNALPHLRREPARALFERLVDPTSISRILDGPRPAFVKRHELNRLLMAVGEIRGAYNYQVVMGEPLQEELTRLQLFQLQVLRAAADVSRQLGMPIENSAWRTALLGVFQSLSERAVYAPAQSGALSRALADHHAALRPLLSDRDRSRLRAELARLAAEESDRAAREAHTRLLGRLAEK